MSSVSKQKWCSYWQTVYVFGGSCYIVSWTPHKKTWTDLTDLRGISVIPMRTLLELSILSSPRTCHAWGCDSNMFCSWLSRCMFSDSRLCSVGFQVVGFLLGSVLGWNIKFWYDSSGFLPSSPQGMLAEDTLHTAPPPPPPHQDAHNATWRDKYFVWHL